jgi:hypothetical protein
LGQTIAAFWSLACEVDGVIVIQTKGSGVVHLAAEPMTAIPTF